MDGHHGYRTQQSRGTGTQQSITGHGDPRPVARSGFFFTTRRTQTRTLKLSFDPMQSLRILTLTGTT